MHDAGFWRRARKVCTLLRPQTDGLRSMRFPLASLAALSLVSFAAVAADPPPVTVIRAGKLIDVAQGRVLENQTIVVRGDRIETVGASAAPEGAKVIDLSGYTVLPGLIDTHTHVTGDPTLPPYHGYGISY